MSRPAVNLSHEVLLLLRALEGVMLLSQQFAELHFTPAQEVRFRIALPAMMVLLRERLRQVERVARGDADPAGILVEENRADESDRDAQEVRLATWSARRRMRKLRAEMDRLERRLSATRQGHQDGR